METVFKLVSADPKVVRSHGADSTADRLSSVYTFYLLMCCAAFVQFSQLFGDPVQCWCPAHFTDTHAEYTNKKCWTSDTYYLPHSERIPKSDGNREYVSYYRWVGLALAAQAIFFYLPRPLWASLSSFCGISPVTVSDAAIKCSNEFTKEGRQTHVEYIVAHLDRFLSKLPKGCFGCLKGHFLPILYILIKAVYLANVVGQLYLMNSFLNTDYSTYGYVIMTKMSRGEPWTNSNRFPRVTLCDFSVRLLGNVHRYTVQCALPMNFFNEIIYIFLWFWFVFVAGMTVGSMLIRLVYLIPYFNRRFIRKRLIARGTVQKDKPEKVKKFMRYLKGDGCFMLRVIADNTTDLLTADIIDGLWDKCEETPPSLLRSMNETHQRGPETSDDKEPSNSKNDKMAEAGVKHV